MHTTDEDHYNFWFFDQAVAWFFFLLLFSAMAFDTLVTGCSLYAYHNHNINKANSNNLKNMSSFDHDGQNMRWAIDNDGAVDMRTDAHLKNTAPVIFYSIQSSN